MPKSADFLMGGALLVNILGAASPNDFNADARLRILFLNIFSKKNVFFRGGRLLPSRAIRLPCAAMAGAIRGFAARYLRYAAPFFMGIQINPLFSTVIHFV